MNSIVKEKLSKLPKSPGVYFHKSASGEIIYVGKAAVLKNRLPQYFQSSRRLDSKTIALVGEIADIDWVETDSEVDALFLESELIKRYKPRYNVLLRDDKYQSYVRINMRDQWPIVKLVRAPGDDGAEYIGPFYNSRNLKKALRYLRRVFPYFTSPPKITDSKLERQIGLKPDLGEGESVYKTNLRQLISYLKGNRKKLVRQLEADMKAAAGRQDFELAAKLRNRLNALSELQSRIIFGDQESIDLSKDLALSQLAQILGLDCRLRRIECFDISHMSGRDVVASMVVFTDGVSDRTQYRKFKTSQKNDDVGNLYEAVFRRFSPKNVKAWGVPNLVMIDGGKSQLAAGQKALRDRGVSLACVAIAKREEEIVVEASDDLVQIGLDDENFIKLDGHYKVINLHPGQLNASAHSKNLRGANSTGQYDAVIKLFQRIRDESHRFAISYHSNLKRLRQTKNILEEIDGVGPKTRSKLLKKFGSLSKISQANMDEISSVVGSAKAAIIYEYIHNKSIKKRSKNMSFTTDFFINNRKNLAKRLDGGLVILAAYQPMQQTADIENDFVQESNFWYLSGIDCHSCFLIFDGIRNHSWLVYPQQDEIDKVFNGSPDYQALAKESGIDEVVCEVNFDDLLRQLRRSHSTVYTVKNHKRPSGMVPNPAQKLLTSRLDRVFGSVQNCQSDLLDMRAIKHPQEVSAIKKAIKITNQAFDLIKDPTKDYKYEYQVEADFWQVFRSHNAHQAYQPIIANQKNACTLHYIKNDGKLAKKSLTLLDCGAEFSHYNADITRVIDFAGDATDRQVEVYQKLAAAQRTIVKLIEPGLAFRDYQNQVDGIMKAAIDELGLNGQLRDYFPHAVSHGLGLDVHDSLGSYDKFEAGMVLTVEPGIYIKKESIGVRIEDDLLVTDTGVDNLSADIDYAI
ncbi:hypothetical protein CR956_00780 [Candidatus Saccharibacteria bacterium]|nr:MAG: hypothetical protein CR956_00780 [Candidatus Saccharibacteria bacterium]